jgi:CBS domain-containing protein
MRTIDAVHRSAVGLGPGHTIREAAGVMDQAGVGSLAIIDDDRLVGIVTDRDLVRRGLARGLPADARVDSVMSSPAITIDAEVDVHEAFGLLRRNAVRRLAVVQGGRSSE